MPKSPFEKVRSLVERKKLFEALLAEQTAVVCKGDGEILFELKPMTLVGDSHIQGFMTGIEGPVPKQDMPVLGNFSVGADRFFFKADLKVHQDEASFSLQSEVYRLQRRTTMRLHLPSSLGVYLALTEYKNKFIYSVAQIADISAGGARIFFSDVDSPTGSATHSQVPDLKPGDQFKAVLHIGDHKTLELKVEVKHVQQAVFHGQIVNHFGTEFVELTPLIKSRLLAMTMDLQRKLIFVD